MKRPSLIPGRLFLMCRTAVGLIFFAFPHPLPLLQSAIFDTTSNNEVEITRQYVAMLNAKEITNVLDVLLLRTISF